MADFAAARLNMVESQVRIADVTDVRIHDAMREIARERFMSAAKSAHAYADIEVEYAAGSWLLKPRDVAKLLQALRPMPGERALALGAPYAAALLAHMGVTVEAGQTDPAAAPGSEYDIVVVEGAVAKAPAAWLHALKTGGRLGLVERDGPVGKACLYVRAEGGVGRRELFDSFAPVLAGFEAQHGFAL